MKYVYLAAWTREFANFKGALDKVWLHQDALYLGLIGGDALVFVLNMKDSFVYHQSACPMPKEAREIWRNLRNSQLRNLRMRDDDRILELDLHLQDIYGEDKDHRLVCELMPPKPNVIIIRKDRNLIMDALIKYSLADNPMRMVMVNQPYYPPKTSFEPDPAAVATIPAGFETSSINEYFRLRHQEILKPQDKALQLKHKVKIIDKELKRLKKRLEYQRQDLANAERAEYFHACAEAIKPNMHKIKPGQEQLVTTNYLDPDLQEICVPLLVDKTPHQNLNYYIKRYQKAKNGLAIIGINISRTKAEIEAVKKLRKRLEDGEDLDLDIKDKSGTITQKISQLDKILHFKYSDDWHIYIGRKAKENDFVTTKIGKAQDWWFHSRIYRGAHVLLRNLKKQELPPDLLKHCSALAAWYSQAKFSANVPVDYTQIRYVRKPKGSAAGFVTYTNYKTFFATPQDLRSIRGELGK
ncbi:MAG: NFACT RNA binding domain-containing protein [Candidatus Cloacimonadaceae bacterium]|jgi:predicted ribosome quality control (RQC) complex YloA/Tae2 family protein|nr:NFACT RNA binding domain-containing protein [Candidatus Cloacimonadota bacterium]MDY0127160.1 NFACT RNA binding domain-containing protein [Candidatus Cloacimonadaceae bacterium]MCB5255162.1 NFACT RNA binding domain-containing protein [Candidatus Cloacimonadota bacterium]MCK9177635.1 NFACT RNA binding domain-containing protein [Candidatus Cloacimonadota bacterium]MCK9242257.1 NFACT RNA binding domain-containing protein [Candidatus Cloacimonadota bacterium]